MIPNSSVLSTVIGERAKELQSLRPSLMGSFIYPGWVGTSITEDIASQFSLQDGIEELFKNITINLMTLQPNLTSPYAPPASNVTLTTYHNVYSYSVSKLWIAYGLSIGFSTICVLAGLRTLVSNRAYYSADFSTVLRALKASHLSVKIDPADTDGKQPLPKYIGGAKIAFEATHGRDAAVYSQVKVANHQPDTELESAIETRHASSGRVSPLASGEMVHRDHFIGEETDHSNTYRYPS
ncbi:hypothetical protein K505DRAFT_250056 [Melanomma pulvis-pyrius CBS 109.77]|uniref:Uncharacterized protein n=1 Tax=Melanomma pulvis-pyrius CBS 109.77 TaxID=1314802 RepID=A0A6A6X378_9PLEO|nr:hypothetical protein K505DRAFT_250056 [Melanomma pulvis-pyrius CBS 109.77]